MPLRSGREYQKVLPKAYKKEFIRQLFMPNQQPINLILLKEQSYSYSVNIDFDNASNEWRKNKISLGNGMFKYNII
jgi:hypothetical protein